MTSSFYDNRPSGALRGVGLCCQATPVVFPFLSIKIFPVSVNFCLYFSLTYVGRYRNVAAENFPFKGKKLKFSVDTGKFLSFGDWQHWCGVWGVPRDAPPVSPGRRDAYSYGMRASGVEAYSCPSGRLRPPKRAAPRHTGQLQLQLQLRRLKILRQRPPYTNAHFRKL